MVDDEQAIELGERRPGFFACVLQVGGHEVEFGIGKGHFKAENAVGQFAVGIFARGDVAQVACDADTGVFGIASAYRVLDVLQRFASQLKRQVAHYALGARTFNGGRQVQHSRQALAWCGCIVTGVPEYACLALRVGIGKADIGQFNAHFAAVYLPAHLGLQGIERQAGLGKYARKFGAAALKLQIHAAA